MVRQKCQNDRFCRSILHYLHYNTYIKYDTILTLFTIQNSTSFIDRIIFSSVPTYLKFYLAEQNHMQIFQYYNET